MSNLNLQGPYHLRPIQQSPPAQNSTFRPASHQTPTSYAIYIRNPPPAYGLGSQQSQAQNARLADLEAALGMVSASVGARSTAGSAQINIPNNIAAGFQQFTHASQQPLLRPGQQAFLPPSLPAHLLLPQLPYAQQSQQGHLQQRQVPQTVMTPQRFAGGLSSGGNAAAAAAAAVGKTASRSTLQEVVQISEPASGIRHQPLGTEPSAPGLQHQLHSQMSPTTATGPVQAGRMQQDILSALQQPSLAARKQPTSCLPDCKMEGRQSQQQGSWDTPQQGSGKDWQPPHSVKRESSKSSMAADRVAVSAASLREEKPKQMPPSQVSAQSHLADVACGSRNISQDTFNSLHQTGVWNDQGAAAAAGDGQTPEQRQQQSHGPSIDSLNASNSWLPTSKPQPVDDGQRATAGGYPILIQ